MYVKKYDIQFMKKKHYLFALCNILKTYFFPLKTKMGPVRTGGPRIRQRKMYILQMLYKRNRNI